MKTIGLIGGISWLSSAEYYRLMNEMVNERMGAVNSAKIILYSVNYEEIKHLTFAGDWQGIAKMISGIAQNIENAGADCILLGANTMHRIASEVQQAISVPLIHIAAATGKAIEKLRLTKVALLGTKYTMEHGFYQQQLEKYNITAILPDEADRQYIHDAIYNEMGKNIFLSSTKEKMLTIIDKLIKDGAEGVILGCTEIPILIKQTDCSIPVFDTTFIHASAAVEYALG
ncbi:MAG TPA: aspartate/glutamate racemase family protein [Chitinophagaceae bacterium]|nr:aspartate/glutamate racemase family protein [Chitinophagaceae bacterium]